MKTLRARNEGELESYTFGLVDILPPWMHSILLGALVRSIGQEVLFCFFVTANWIQQLYKVILHPLTEVRGRRNCSNGQQAKLVDLWRVVELLPILLWFKPNLPQFWCLLEIEECKAGSTIESETSLWTGLSVGRLISWLVDRSVCHNFLAGVKFYFHAPIRALVSWCRHIQRR